MKMKNMLIGGMSLALVACISVGATLAYLTDKSDTATNTFTMQDGIELQLWETADAVSNDHMYKQIKVGAETGVTPGYTAITGTDSKGYEGANQGINYSEVLPGAEISKKPRLKVTQGADSWVYLKVTDNTEKGLAIQDINTTQWTKVGENVTEDIAIYRYNTPVAKGDWTETPLFTTVKVPENATSDTIADALGNIIMEGYAIQANGFDDGTEADAVMQTESGAFWGTCTAVPAATTEVTE